MVKFILRINFVHMWTSENQNRKIYQVFIFLTKYDSYPQVEQVVVTADPVSVKPQVFRKKHLDTLWSASFTAASVHRSLW